MKQTIQLLLLLSFVTSTTFGKDEQSTFEIKDSKNYVPQYILQWLHKKDAPQLVVNENYRIEGLVGAYPPKIYWIIDQLKQEGTPFLSNRLILYGPPGNGKSTLARAIAKKAGCNFVSLNGPSVVGSYLGEGAQKIQNLFEFAAEQYKKTNKRQIVFIDEIDAICRANINYEAPARAEHQVATQELWLALDKYKHNPGIFFICATNHFDKLDRTFLDRFNSNTIEIPNPDAMARRNVLLHYLDKHKISFEESLLQAIVKNTEGLSVRTLEDLVQDVAISRLMYGSEHVTSDTVWELLRETKKKYAASVNPEIRKKTWREFFSLNNQDAFSVAHYIGLLPAITIYLYSRAYEAYSPQRQILESVDPYTRPLLQA